MSDLKLEIGKTYQTGKDRIVTIVGTATNTLCKDQMVFIGSDHRHYSSTGGETIGSITISTVPFDTIVRELKSAITSSASDEDYTPLEIEKGRVYTSRSGKKVAIVQHVPEAIVKTEDEVILSRIPEHFVGSNQERYRKDGKMYQNPGKKYDPLETEFVRNGQGELDYILNNGASLKKTLSVAEATAIKIGLFFNYTLLRLK